MKLYELARHSLFTLNEIPDIPVSSPKGIPDVIYKLRNLDGMYSYVTDARGDVYHFAAWTEVTPYEDTSVQAVP